MNYKRHLERSALVLLFCFLQLLAFSQAKTVTGKVTSSNGEAIPGASIVIKGTTSGIITNLDGEYTITVPDENAVLVFSFLGYLSEEVLVNGQSVINITLIEDLMELDEVVVVGYGVTKKNDLTGAVGSLKAEDFNAGVLSSPEQIMQGKIAGVQITSNNGEPGSGMVVQIRGANSIRSNTMPLYVIDGMPLDIQNTSPDGATSAGINTSSSATNPMNFLNADDIESIDVLKDASASAIYGARGANGVVLITTKKGKSGQSSINYSFSGSISKIPKMLEVLSAEEYVRFREDSLGRFEDHYGSSTNWQEEIFRTAFSQNHNLSLSGGNENTQYRASFGYLSQEGIIENSDMKRYNGRLNITQKAINNKLLIEANLNASQVDENRVPIGNLTGFEGDLILNALQSNPTMPVLNDSGTYFQPSAVTKRNPVAMLNLIDDNTVTNRILGNLSGRIEILPGLAFKTSIGLDNSTAVRRIDVSRQLNYMATLGGSASINNRELQSWVIENTLNYSRAFGIHSFDVLAGYSYQEFLIRGYNIYTVGYTTDEIKYTNNIDGSDITQSSPSSYALINELQSFFGRVNYNLNDRYLATATIRRDGSTKFGDNNKYGNFPSVGLAWRLSQEEFVKSLDVFSNLKLRFGWGKTGNQEIGSKYSLFTIATNNGAKGVLDGTNVITGYVLERTPSPDIKWESTAQTNLGVDFGIFRGRLSGTIDLFKRNTTDMLFELSSKQPAPTSTQMVNIDGTIINKGIELGLSGVILTQEKLNWTMDVNFTAIRNTIEDLPVSSISTGQASGQGMTGVRVQIIENGEPINSFYGPKFRGFNEAGRNLFEGENGNDTTSASYKQLIGSPLPKFTYSFNNSFRYGSFDLNIFLQGVYGNKIYNNTANSISTVANINSGNNTFPDVITTNESRSNSTVFSDRFIEDGSYLRLSSLSLGYTLPIKDIKAIKAFRCYISGNNLFVITKYTGYDPDVNSDAGVGGVASLGIDNTNYPKSRSLTIGMNITF